LGFQLQSAIFPHLSSNAHSLCCWGGSPRNRCRYHVCPQWCRNHNLLGTDCRANIGFRDNMLVLCFAYIDHRSSCISLLLLCSHWDRIVLILGIVNSNRGGNIQGIGLFHNSTCHWEISLFHNYNMDSKLWRYGYQYAKVAGHL